MTRYLRREQIDIRSKFAIMFVSDARRSLYTRTLIFQRISVRSREETRGEKDRKMIFIN